MALHILADNRRKVFNILDLSSGVEICEWDSRCQEFWDKGLDFSFLPAIKDSSLEYIRSLWEQNGYVFDRDFCFAWKFRKSLKQENQRKPVAVVVLDKRGAVANENMYREFLQKNGFLPFFYFYDFDSEDWILEIQNRHNGTWDDSTGMEFIPVSEGDRAEIVIVSVDICDDAGFAVFRTLRRGVENDIPVFVVSAFKDFDLTRIIRAVKMGAESVIEQRDGFLEELKRAIDDSMPTSYPGPPL